MYLICKQSAIDALSTQKHLIVLYDCYPELAQYVAAASGQQNAGQEGSDNSHQILQLQDVGGTTTGTYIQVSNLYIIRIIVY